MPDTWLLFWSGLSVCFMLRVLSKQWTVCAQARPGAGGQERACESTEDRKEEVDCGRQQEGPGGL